MLSQAQPRPVWRSWLVLIVSGFGVLTALAGGAVMLTGGGIALMRMPAAELNTLSLFNLAWVTLFVGVLCAPAAVFSFMEIRAKPVLQNRRGWFLVASAGMLLWGGLVFLFAPVETSPQAWVFLPPLVLLTTILPLWWYLEIARRGTGPEPLARTWGVASFSLLITLPLIIALELVVLILAVVAGGAYLSTQPGFEQQMIGLQQLLADPNFDPLLVMDFFNGLLQRPVVIFGLLILVSGIIPLIEELFKPLAVWLYAGDRLTPAQGFLAGTISGACFALWENLTALSASGDGTGTAILVARVGTGLLHITTAGLVSWGMASFWEDRRRLGRLIGTYILAVVLHGLWNASGVISGVAPLLQFPLDAPSGLSQTLTNVGIGVLGTLVLVNLGLLLTMNANLRAARPAEVTERSSPAESSPEPEQASDQPNHLNR